MSALRKTILSYLDTAFPGSTLADGHDLIRLVAPAHRGVTPRRIQAVVDAIGGARWLIVAGADPHRFAPGAVFERTEFISSPDYNVQETVPGWFVELSGTPADVNAIGEALSPLGALAVLAPGKNVAFHASKSRVYAASLATLNELTTGHPELFTGESTMTLTGQAANDLLEQLARGQDDHRARRLAEEKQKAAATEKQPFDLAALAALGVDVTLEGRLRDPASQRRRLEELYYVDMPHLRTLAELAAAVHELAKWSGG